MKKIYLFLYLYLLVAIQSKAQTAWNATAQYNTGDKVSIQLTTTNTADGTSLSIPYVFVCTQANKGIDPSVKNNTYAWSVYNDGTIITFISGYKYTVGTRVYLYINKQPYVFYCSSENQTDPLTGNWAWYVDPNNGAVLPLLSGCRYVITGTMARYNNMDYMLTTECYPPQIDPSTANPKKWAWSNTSINSLWTPSVFPSPASDNPVQPISRNGKVVIKPATGYGPQLTLSNNGIDMLSTNQPNIPMSVPTTLHADGTGLTLARSAQGVNSFAKLNNDGTLELHTNSKTIIALTVGYSGSGTTSPGGNYFTVSSDGNVVSSSLTTKALAAPANSNIVLPNGGWLRQTDGAILLPSYVGIGMECPSAYKLSIKDKAYIQTGLAIGTTTLPSAYKLAVGGAIIAEKITVKLQHQWPVPDYVFKKSYKLPSLDDVERYVKAHSHLPEVPSEKEILSEGLDIAQMNIILLKKVEELTLYLIEQNKKMEQQAKDIEMLKRKNR